MTGSLSPAALHDEIVRLTATLPHHSDPRDADELLVLLRLLHATGRRDLPLGRLFEGHVDAGQIIRRYGTPGQAPPAGAVLGVWNADLPGEPPRLTRDGGAWRLSGAKAYASGSGILSHALIGSDGEGGRQLVLLDLAAVPPAIDRSWWRVIGMQRSETHVVRWVDAAVPGAALIGAAGDYAREPFLSGGALRFVAVQAGGVAGLFDRVRDHLVATGRAADPHQAGRLAELFALAEGIAGVVRDTARRWFAEGDEARLPRVSAARAAVLAAGERAVMVAEAAVGLPGMFVDHPLSATIADLSVYLRQPMPDAQRMRVAAAAAAGLLVPEL
ncbi:acyl-CoA dehydrogenase [uncultured Sphingomonas sp.]|uniref:acyl-CoA dehydrogenase n=1 Tax=uncultured Sphingomonas sp. TaxID=158754 RepID=UPI0035CC603A